MDPQKSNMTVLAQVVKCIPPKIIDPLAKKTWDSNSGVQSDQSRCYTSVWTSSTFFELERCLRQSSTPRWNAESDPALHSADTQRFVLCEPNPERGHGRGTFLVRL